MNKMIRNHPDFPGIVFRRLRNNEIVKEGDYMNSKNNTLLCGWMPAANGYKPGYKIEPNACNWIYRPVPHLSNLPD